jgi:L-ascorbate metabolism protein UlaG (beta-lactamase superfamily)
MNKSNIQIQWFPPSWVGIRTEKNIIYIDPAYLRTNFSHYPKRIEFTKWPDPIDGLPEELEKADVILVTHHHKDHCKHVTVKRLCMQSTQIIAPRSCIKELGESITVIKAGTEIVLDKIKVKAVEAYNLPQGTSAKIMHKKGKGVGYLINIGDEVIYHAGDTDNIPEMRNIGRVDVALLPIGGRGFTMDIDEAVKAIEIINPKIVIPMHQFESDAKKLKTKAESRTTAKVVSLEVGGIYELK